MIDNKMLDTLTDFEILIFNAILKGSRFTEIAMEFKLHRGTISDIMFSIYRKLDVWPMRPAKLKYVWRISIAENKMQIELKKVKAPEELPRPCRVC